MRIILLLAAACLLTAGGASATGVKDSKEGEEILLAQSLGFDPMRPMQRAPAQSDRPPGNPELGDLPDAPGAEETFYMCSACHSIALVKQQRITDTRWDYLWRWMIEEQGMADPGEELREVILGYLKQYYSSER